MGHEARIAHHVLVLILLDVEACVPFDAGLADACAHSCSAPPETQAGHPAGPDGDQATGESSMSSEKLGGVQLSVPGLVAARLMA